MAPASQEALAQRLMLTAAAASIAESCTYPVDMVKTQLQLRTKLGAGHLTGVGALPTAAAAAGQQHVRLGGLGIARQLVQQQGISGLYAGLSPAILRHLFYTCTRIGVYEEFRAAYMHASASSTGSHPGSSAIISSGPTTQSNGSSHGDTTTVTASDTGNLPFGVKLLLGLAAGATGQMLAVPADLLKVRMQADARAVQMGMQQLRRYPNLMTAAAVVWKEAGLLGMWRGGLPAVQRAALVNLGELATYDQAKSAVLSSGVVPEGVWTHTAASMCSGLVASLVSTPADVIKTRLMAQQAQQQNPDRPARSITHSSSSSSSSSVVQGTSAPTAGGKSASGSDSSVRRYSSTAAPTLRPRQLLHRHCYLHKQQQQQPHSAVGSFDRGWTCHVTGRSTSSTAVQYRGAWDCLVKTVKADGVFGLYKGFLPTWARLGPWQLVFWVTYEQLRRAAHLDAF